ncbi:MAG: hypothetical protein ACLU6O_04400, partial [Bilophila wadsworthia]
VQYFLQFYPPMLYEAQKILATIVETAWEARGRMLIEPGWTGNPMKCFPAPAIRIGLRTPARRSHA